MRDERKANAIGRTPVGGGRICAIDGQKPTAYVAMDCGSEMPSYDVYRNSQQPPADWRKANPGRARDSVVDWHKANPEKRRKHRAKWREANSEAIK